MVTKSVYNFIPAPEEDKVFKPEWAEKVSHDIPFEDGESGEIDIEITAQTPIYIRNGHSKSEKKIYDAAMQKKNDKNNYKFNTEELAIIKKYESFSKMPNGDFFIPASSLKGVIRNALEVFSFSRLNPNLVDNNRYSYRDLSNGSQYLNNYNTNQVKAGWLKQDEEGNWTITECAELIPIHHEEVDKLLNGKYKNNFIGFRKYFLHEYPKEKSAKWKYKQVADLQSLNVEYNSMLGKLVFTGQSSKRFENKGRPSGKVHEFFFSDERIKTHELSKSQQKDFRFIYSEHDSNNISPDWKYWKEKLSKNEEVPVFFNLANGKVKHFGLAYMYKLPYKNSIHELSPIKTYLENKKADLATTMFGCTQDESLKGRVFFGHAVSENAEADEKKKEILAGPKASFHTFYLTGGDYDNPNSKLQGFKKYPVHTSEKGVDYTDKQKKNNKVFTEFIPLKERSTFKGKIRFHNLKKIEIGALLSALTFHNQSDKYSHSIGSAKPLGYGKIQIQTKINSLKYSLEEYLYTFEKEMNKVNNRTWKDNEAIWKFFAMSKTNISEKLNQQYVYPEMNQEKRINEFTDKAKLPQYSKDQVEIKSIVEDYEQKQKAQEQSAYEKIKNTEDIASLEDFLQNFPNTTYKASIENDIKRLNENAEFKHLQESNDIDKLEGFAIRCINDEHKKVIRARIDELRRENKTQKAEELANAKLNIQEKNYKAIIAKMRELKKLKIELNEEQKNELKQDIKASFSNTNSANEYKKGFNKNPKRLKGAWKEFVKNALSYNEIKELHSQFLEFQDNAKA